MGGQGPALCFVRANGYPPGRWIGQNGLLGRHSLKRHKARRRRIETVMQELMYVAARVVKTAGSLKLAFGRGCRSLPAFEYVYRQLAYG